MSEKKRCVACPCDASEKNQKFLGQFVNSLKKFHPDIEVKFYDNPNPEDKDFWYRAKAILAKQLFLEGYDEVCIADVDQIVLGDLSDIWEGDYDIASVMNDPSFPIGVWDIGPQFGVPYYNNGLVVIKNQQFVDHWMNLNFSPHFSRYQYREQDTQNLLVSDYFNYKNRNLDEGDKIYGEFGKPFWASAKLVDGKVMVDVNGVEKQLMIIHFGGGNTPDKGNYRIRFSEEIVKHIEELIK